MIRNAIERAVQMQMFKKKSSWLAIVLAVVVICPLAIGRKLYVLRVPVVDDYVRVGRPYARTVKAVNDPNESWPYRIGLRIGSVSRVGGNKDIDGMVITYGEPNVVTTATIRWMPEMADVGQHNMRIVAYDASDPNRINLNNTKVVRINVLPFALKPIIMVDVVDGE
ncbi:MAG: hypothetical protein GY941_21860 [Planctomycetes bacterium]|nr:hypothetical protein [Planctomycetota bacterium]